MLPMSKLHVIGVIGGSVVPAEVLLQARELGKEIASRGCMLICGGMGGVMEAACKGAKEGGGTTIGILPGEDKSDANQYVDVSIASGLGIARNVLIVRTADVVIALNGSYGTLSEMALALNLGKRVIALGSWKLEDAGVVEPGRLVHVTSPLEAVDTAMQMLEQ